MLTGRKPSEETWLRGKPSRAYLPLLPHLVETDNTEAPIQGGPVRSVSHGWLQFVLREVAEVSAGVGMEEGSASLLTPGFCLGRRIEILQKRIVWRKAFVREDSSSNTDRNSKQSVERVEVGG